MSITTSHSLAKELLDRPDANITIAVNEDEYLISNIRKKATCANADDTSIYWTLNEENKIKGNIIR